MGTVRFPTLQKAFSRLLFCAVRLFCPYRLGRNKEGRLRVLCYQYGGESQTGLQPSGSPTDWRCIALEKLSGVRLVEGAWRTAPNHSRPGSCVADADTTRRTIPNAIHRTDIEELPEQLSGKDHSQSRDGIRIMPLGTNAAIRGRNSGAGPGAMCPSRASYDLQSVPTPTPVSAPGNPAR
jgi:hypothetical protein